jgi:hypothetical protein
LLAACAALGCGSAHEPGLTSSDWTVVAGNEEAALLSVSGTAADDVWLVGADDGSGPLVLHGDGSAWTREDVAPQGALWWVQALPDGSVYASGSGGSVFERRAGAWARLPTPALADATVFGVWSPGAGELYAVGAEQQGRGFLWHSAGGVWSELPLPSGLPLDEHAAAPALFKVWGASAADVWVVGDRGVILRGNAEQGFARIVSGSEEERLFTVHGAGDQVVIVGGSANGWALETGGAEWSDISPPGAAPLQGVCVSASGELWTVGVAGSVYARAAGQSEWRDVLTRVAVESLHAVWLDPQGGVWAVGGNVLTTALDRGVALHLAR